MRNKQSRGSSIGTKGSGLLRLLLSAALLFGLIGTAHAQSVTDVQEWGKRIQSGSSIGTLGTNQFGDSTSFYDGSTSFSVTDIDLPGNSALPVRVGRTLAAQDAGAVHAGGGLMANWDLDIPYIGGVFSMQNGWKTQGSNAYARCSNATIGGAAYIAVLMSDSNGIVWDYWRGNSLYIPGQGRQSLLEQYAGPTPSDGQTTALGTLDFSQVRCLSSLANPGSGPGFTGEAFLVTDGSGTKYTFNWMVTLPFSTMTRQYGNTQLQLPRMEVRLYPTQIQDRFGNTVTYTWSGSQLSGISSSDGRSISFTYNSDGTIATVTANNRVWKYSYNAGTLTGVLLPDGSSWSMNTPQLTFIYCSQGSGCSPPSNCDDPGGWYGNLAKTFTFVHPSGATGTFTFSPTRHGRTQVPRQCFIEPDFTGKVDYGPPILRDNFALTQKQITGPGLPTLTWSTSFSAAAGGYTNCGSSCPPDTQTVTATNPDGSYTVYTYGIRYYIDEGKLLHKQTYTASGTLVRDESTSYALNPSSPPYARQVGIDGAPHTDNFSGSYQVPRTQTTLQQDNDSYTNTVNSFDNFARALSTTRANSFSVSRTDVKAYFDDTQHWVLGQVKSITNSDTGAVLSSADYDPNTAQPTTTYKFGLAQLSFTYNADGTMATIKDGLSHTVTLSNWKRGAPQNAQFPDNSTKSAVIDDNGWVTATTDARGNQTSYGYDSMGRDTSVTYPISDTGITNPTGAVNWTSPGTSYVVLSASELGVPAGSWRARTIVGRMQTSTYYDGLWRPVLVEEKDTNSGVVRYTSTAYDYGSRVTFKSYPSTSYNASAGVNSVYDTLGRLTQKTSTDGPTLQTINYQSGSRQQVIDASGYATTTTYQAFDAPSGSNPVLISAPGQTTTIYRTVLGEITRLDQSGNEGTLTDRYIYDGYHRLCRRTEPETGQTVFSYDAASQIVWTAKGQTDNSGTCAYGSVPSSAQIVNQYDPMGRPHTKTFPDGSGNITLGYDLDGHLTSAVNPTATWSYSWNKRGLLTAEQAVIDGKTYTLTPGYDTLANLYQQTYPDGAVIIYSPDAWGRPTQVGGYAGNVAYWPNGIPSGYTLGNGLSYRTALDSRQRLQSQQVSVGSSNLQSLTYKYNDDNDVIDIADNVDGSDSVRNFQYDGLHRLLNADGAWGSYGYVYDAFNNIKARTGANALTYSYDYTGTNHLTGVSGAVSRSYSYDGEGHISGDGARSFNWNEADEITGIPGEATYYYDAHGKRIKTAFANGATEYALYDLAGALMYSDKISAAGGGAAAPASASSASTSTSAAPNSTSTAVTVPVPPIQVSPLVPQLECSYTNNLNPNGPPQDLQPGSQYQPGPTTSSSIVTLSWCGTPADSYTLYVWAWSGSFWNVYHEQAITANSYSAVLTDNTSYYWQVQSCVHGLECHWSPAYYFNTPVAGGGIPAVPTDPNPGSASAPGPTVGDKTVMLSWYGSADVSYYNVEVFDQSTNAIVSDTNTSATSYAAALSYGKAYKWMLNACDGWGCSYPPVTLYFQTPTPVVETQTDYLALGGHMIAQTALAGGVSTVTYLHADLLGSPRLATNASQGVLWHEHFDPYGQKMTGAAEKIGFTGHAYDAESGLTYMQARFYDAAVGRFLSSDPIPFKDTSAFTFNRYAYANDNPETNTDPTGMICADNAGPCTSSPMNNWSIDQGDQGGGSGQQGGAGANPSQNAGDTGGKVGGDTWQGWEDTSAQGLKDAGYTVEEQVRVTWEGAEGAYSTVDAVGAKGRNIVMQEAKEGLESKLSSAQKAAFKAAFKSGNVQIVSEQVAQRLGLRAGVSLAKQGSLFVSVNASTLGARSMRQFGRIATQRGAAALGVLGSVFEWLNVLSLCGDTPESCKDSSQ